MAWTGVLQGADHPFEGDQDVVLNQYFGKKRGRVCVSAGAGTGKTTLLVEIYAEAAIRMYNQNPKENPFERILAVTFTIEATRQMKSQVRSRLEKHFLSLGKEEELKDIIRHLESGSWILTLDSLTRELLYNVALDAGLNPVGGVPDAFELSKVEDKIIGHLRTEPDCHDDYLSLSRAFPPDWRGEETDWQGLLKDGFSKARQYGKTAQEFTEAAIGSFKELYLNAFESGKSLDKKTLAAILTKLGNSTLNPDPKRISDSYRHNLTVLRAFCHLLIKYEESYNAETKDKGWLGHDDARFWIIRYIQGKLPNTHYKNWLADQKSRFAHMMVDEFQDTSYGQCELLRGLIGPETGVFLIGDPKQAIYQWRNAEPGIFLQIIDSVPTVESGKTSEKIPYLDADGFVQKELLGNYRSVKDLIDLYNDLFGDGSELFGDHRYTGEYNIPHGNLARKASLPSDKLQEPHIHVMQGDDAAVIASELDAIRRKEKVLHVHRTRNKNEVWEEAEVGDCCVLMQTRSPWPELREQLISRGISYTMIAEKGLFSRPEISLIIDILDWLGNPHNKDALARILRSPLVGLSDRALRFVAYHDFYLDSCLSDKNRPAWFDAEAGGQLQKLIYLRDDLRWLREGRKNEMIEKILRYSHLDTILLSHIEGDQEFANIRYFQDVVSTWEEEALLSYQELVDRLKYFREYGSDDYGMAPLADEKDRGSVRIATVHATKGLEFPIVFHLHSIADMNKQWMWTGYREKIFTSGMGQFVFLQQIPPPGGRADEWEKALHPATKLNDGNNGPFGSITREAYAEKWRLFYVGLTRARDHVYFESYDGRAQCWAAWLNHWLKDHRSSSMVEPSVRERPRHEPSDDELKKIPFDEKRYRRLLEESNQFIPSSLNPSHIYDLIFCPRRYQYSVLQEVKGGPMPMEGKKVDFNAVRFGKHVHEALEIIDFSKGPDNGYDALKSRVAEHDPEEAVHLDEAIEQFLRSDLFSKYGLAKRRNRKELRLLHKIEDPKTSVSILMKDIADLIVEDGKDSIILVDYKTNYPKGESIWDDFMRKHYDYQMASYRDALAKELELNVSKAVFFDYDLSTRKWSEFTPKIHDIDVDGDVRSIMPLSIEQGGLMRKPRKKFCNEYCEFRGMCNPRT